ncbi:MAG: hypothetical protein P1V36_12500 [Planctomycetota bacterium]|nr:hypothetical protein [Planctomycetota bacterium]
MQHRLPPPPPRADLHIGSRELPAVPVHLGGHEASVVVRPGPRVEEQGCLRLDWGDGRRTDLDVRIRRVAGAGPVAEMEICGVAGDWRPFLEYLAQAAA